jgi:predicted enzyme related to lactoylglutathione lyase
MKHIERINTIFVYVQRLKEASEFYENVLGFPKPVIHGKFWIEYELPGGDAHFALHSKEADFFRDHDRSKQAMKCSFEVRDIHAYAALLKSHGVQFVYEPRKDYGFWLAEFLDPEGNRLRLYEKIKK